MRAVFGNRGRFDRRIAVGKGNQAVVRNIEVGRVRGIPVHLHIQNQRVFALGIGDRAVHRIRDLGLSAGLGPDARIRDLIIEQARLIGWRVHTDIDRLSTADGCHRSRVQRSDQPPIHIKRQHIGAGVIGARNMVPFAIGDSTTLNLPSGPVVEPDMRLAILDNQRIGLAATHRRGDDTVIVAIVVSGADPCLDRPAVRAQGGIGFHFKIPVAFQMQRLSREILCNNRGIVGARDGYGHGFGCRAAVSVIDTHGIGLGQRLSDGQIIDIGIVDVKGPSDLATGGGVGRRGLHDRETAPITGSISRKRRCMRIADIHIRETHLPRCIVAGGVFFGRQIGVFGHRSRQDGIRHGNDRSIILTGHGDGDSGL